MNSILIDGKQYFLNDEKNIECTSFIKLYLHNQNLNKIDILKEFESKLLVQF